jgi:hypothetical protein
MNRSLACLRSYVAAWWMKLIAAVVVLAAVQAIVFLKPIAILEPAWPQPTLVHWSEAERELDHQVLADVEGLDVESGFFSLPSSQVRSLVQRLPSLRYCRVQVPGDVGEGTHAESVREAIAAFFDEVAQSPGIDAVELAGVTRIEVVKLMHGSPGIRALYTSQLYGAGAGGDAERLATLVDAVITMPELEVLGLPPGMAAQLSVLDPARTGALAAHPSLRTLLVSPHEAEVNAAVWRSCQKLLPGIRIGVTHVDRGRLSAAWGVLAATMFVSGLLVLSAAGMLVLSAAAVVPDYAATHRRVVLGILVVIASLAAICLWRLNVAVLPATLWAAFAACLPAASLEWDRRQANPGVLVVSVSSAWCVGFIVPLSIIRHGDWWVWLDRFLASNVPTPTTWCLLAGVVGLVVVAWRAIGCYAESLTAHGRAAAVTTSRRDAWRQMSRVSRLAESRFSRLWGVAPVIASRAIRRDRLSGCETAASRRRLLAEGMMTIPLGRLVVHVVVLVVMMPLVLRLTVPGFKENTLLFATALGAIALAAVWFAPLMGWNERSARVAMEIGSVMPRALYVAAVRGLLVRQMLLPMMVVFTLLAGVLFFRGGEAWLVVPLAGVTIAAGVITISTVELALTVRSTFVSFLATFLVGYPAFGASAMSVAVLFNKDATWPVEVWVRYMPFVVLAAMAVIMRVLVSRRIRSFEFGRLV